MNYETRLTWPFSDGPTVAEFLLSKAFGNELDRMEKHQIKETKRVLLQNQQQG
jgi:hypothetical protein